MKVLVLILFLATPCYAQWIPPPLIPVPAFGINEVTPAPTIYVKEATGVDTNPGTLLLPRRTIPTTLSAGTVVRVIGTYTTQHTSPANIKTLGTAGSPTYISGDGSHWTKDWEVSGSYLIIEGAVHDAGLYLLDGPTGAASNNLVVRNLGSTGGIVYSNFHGGQNSNGVIWQVGIVGNYTNQVEAGGDAHCITVGSKVVSLTVVDSYMTHCNGDGIQINGGVGGQVTTGPVFIGRTACNHNRQSCWWAKQSHDVLISYSQATDMRPAPDFINPGACGGGQYYAKNLVFVGVECSDSENGIIVAGYDAGAVAPIAIYNSYFHNIHALFSPYDPNNARSPGHAIILVGGSTRTLQDNVISDVDGAIGVDNGTFVNVRNVVPLGVGPQPVVPADVHAF